MTTTPTTPTTPQQPIATAISAAIGMVFTDSGRESKEALPEAVLAADLGLDSLDLAQVIVLLERSLGVDPFRAGGPIARGPIRTVQDLIAIYTTALKINTVPVPHPHE